MRPNRMPFRVLSNPKFFLQYCQIAYKPEQKQWSCRGLPTGQLGYVHLIVRHSLIFRGRLTPRLRPPTPSGARLESRQPTPKSFPVFPRGRDAHYVALASKFGVAILKPKLLTMPWVRP